MNQYYTEVELEKYTWKLDYSDQVLLMGSCFTENIGAIMEDYKFRTLINPFGISYNPMSVADSLKNLMQKRVYTTDDLFEQAGVWGSFDFHSRYSGCSENDALEKMNGQVERGHEFLKNADYLIITFGTAWVFDLKASGKLVANCHKFPAGDFKRYRLTAGEIVGEFKDLLTALWKFNPKLKILFTISPIRHLKDGANGNQVSKSTLLLAVDRLVNGYGKERCNYFPSYEIVMDELRDYRFYAADLVHLSPLAVEHIWSRFKQAFLTNQVSDLMKKITKIKKAMGHKPFRKDVPQYSDFLMKNLNAIEELTINFPYLNFHEEIQFLETELNGCK
ncbi:GSCFA domain-containing protein [Mangrovibacterium sp.]|uniref:GSCFA domain-containing protein n=1 Tax=Mangrovibacterium sp. TaxID=1961364 RepID=UPI00356ACA5D